MYSNVYKTRKPICIIRCFLEGVYLLPSIFCCQYIDIYVITGLPSVHTILALGTVFWGAEYIYLPLCTMCFVVCYLVVLWWFWGEILEVVLSNAIRFLELMMEFKLQALVYNILPPTNITDHVAYACTNKTKIV